MESPEQPQEPDEIFFFHAPREAPGIGVHILSGVGSFVLNYLLLIALYVPVEFEPWKPPPVETRDENGLIEVKKKSWMYDEEFPESPNVVLGFCTGLTLFGTWLRYNRQAGPRKRRVLTPRSRVRALRILSSGRGPEPTCPVCGEKISPLPDMKCAGCGALHHSDCWAYIGRCGIYGCESRTVQDRRPAYRMPKRFAHAAAN